jgi:hypothetical protein
MGELSLATLANLAQTFYNRDLARVYLTAKCARWYQLAGIAGQRR